MNNQSKTTIIAEAGVNHNGRLDLALKLVDEAASAGADFVKFQTFRADSLASGQAAKASYQTANTDAAESQLDMLRRLELSFNAHRDIMDRCAKRGIAFLSTAFDLQSLSFLADDLQLRYLKIGSGELTNAPLLIAAARTEMSLMLSTGMATLSEVEEALGVIAFGMLRSGSPERRQDFADVLHSAAAWEALRGRVTLLHCTTEYPAAIVDTNLRAMDTMRAAFDLPVGYSDHTTGNAMSIGAVARGACVIEKHFTLDRTLDGPDHAASLEPSQLAELVRDIRAVEAGLGSGVKQPGAAELRNRKVVRKNIVVARGLPAGHVLTLDDLVTKRSSGGISAMDVWNCVGMKTRRPIALGASLNWADLTWAD